MKPADQPRRQFASAAERAGVDWRELRDAQDAATIDNAAKLASEIDALKKAGILQGVEPQGRKYTY